MVDPLIGGGPRPHIDMSDDMKADYEEARRIVQLSPRSACALLRLAVQKFCVEQGQPGKNINDDIKSLVAGGLDPTVQESLDAVRIVGNNAVHPGEMDLTDERAIETATALFDFVNYAIDVQVARPKKRASFLARLPQDALDAVKRRDAAKGS